MSFMKKVAKIAAPFASLIPGVGPLISLGLGAVGSIGGGSSNKKNQQQQSIFSDPAFMAALTASQNAGRQLMDKGSPLVDSGAGYLRQSGDYFGDMLKGGSSLDRAMASPISGYKSQMGQQFNYMASRGPRSGAMQQAAANHMFMTPANIAKMKYEAQANAGGQLAGVGANLLSGGSGLMTGGANSIQNVLQTLLGRMGIQNQAGMAGDQRRADMWGGLGEGAGNLLGILLGPGGLLNKPKPTSNYPTFPTLPSRWPFPGGTPPWGG